MIETTLGDLILALPTLTRLASVQVSAQTAYHIATLCRLVNVETAHYETQRIAAIQDLGEPRQATEAEMTAGGLQTVQEVPPARREAFRARLAPVAAVVVTLQAPPLRLADVASVALSGLDVLALGPLLTDG